MKNAKPMRFMADINAPFKIKDPATAKEGGNAFYDSLAVLSENDIILNEAAVSLKKPPFDIVRYAVLLLLVGTLFYSGYHLADRLYAYMSAAREYDALREIFHSALENTQDAEVLRRTRVNSPIQDILYLQRRTGERVVEEAGAGGGPRNEGGRNKISTQRLTDMNRDFHSWIKVSHTRIDYPVVKGANNDFYLTHTFERAPNSSGAIFVDFRNNWHVLDNYNFVVYGHNMLDGSMFQPIIAFGNRRDYFNEGIIEIITEEATYYYKIFSAREECAYANYIQKTFETDEDWVAFLNRQQSLSNFNNNLQFTANDRIITLSTCINEATSTRGDLRFTVQGVLIDIQ
jgi:sortase B